MRDDREKTRSGLSRAREIALAMCTVWLIVQNCVLLAFVPWDQLPSASRVATAVVRAAVLVGGPLWIAGAAALLGWAYVTWLAHGTRAANNGDWEVGHGRAR